MRYYVSLLVSSTITLSIAACTVAPEGDGHVAARTSALTLTDAVAPLVALAAPSSDGGAALTAAEAASYVAQVEAFDADTSIDALALIARFNDGASSAQVGAVTAALRAHVETVRISGFAVTGLTLSSCGGAATTAVFDPQRAPYKRVTLVYSPDSWSSSFAADLALGADGFYRAGLPGLVGRSRVTFALAVTGPDGRLAWLDNPRENGGNGGHLDYAQATNLCTRTATPHDPQLARFVRALSLPESLGGTTVTWDEMSALVAYTTYDGGPGMDDPEVINPALDALTQMAAQGVAFEGDTRNVMTAFLTQMRMHTATSPALRVFHTDPGYVIATPTDARVQAMRVYYSTDGWNTPKTADCTPLGRAGLVNCDLGYLPKNTLIAYSAYTQYADGHGTWIHADDGGNLFQAVK